MDISLFEKIFEKHRKSIGDFNYDNPKKLVILFTGIPGSGKTTIAKHLQSTYHALRVNNDMTRDLFREELATEDFETLQKYALEYFNFLLQKTSTLKNKIIIIDSSIDRKYDRIAGYFLPLGYSLFLIKLVVPLETIKKRLQQREGDPTNYYKELDRWIEDNNRFSDEHTPDFVINSGTKSELDSLCLLIDKKLQQQH